MEVAFSERTWTVPAVIRAGVNKTIAAGTLLIQRKDNSDYVLFNGADASHTRIDGILAQDVTTGSVAGSNGTVTDGLRVVRGEIFTDAIERVNGISLDNSTVSGLTYRTLLEPRFTILRNA